VVGAPSEGSSALDPDEVGEEAEEPDPAGVTPAQLTDETTECAFGWPALAIWARQSPGSACTFGPLPWRLEGPEVTVGAAVWGAAAVNPALPDDASVGVSLEWVGATELGAPPPIETAAAAVAVPAPTTRRTAITVALAGRAFENIFLLLTVAD
jgi:hypothetical protein